MIPLPNGEDVNMPLIRRVFHDDHEDGAEVGEALFDQFDSMYF